MRSYLVYQTLDILFSVVFTLPEITCLFMKSSQFWGYQYTSHLCSMNTMCLPKLFNIGMLVILRISFSNLLCVFCLPFDLSSLHFFICFLDCHYITNMLATTLFGVFPLSYIHNPQPTSFHSFKHNNKYENYHFNVVVIQNA